jgi:hypothetical protein
LPSTKEGRVWIKISRDTLIIGSVFEIRTACTEFPREFLLLRDGSRTSKTSASASVSLCHLPVVDGADGKRDEYDD